LLKFIKKNRTFIVHIHDCLAIILAWIISYHLRFNFDIPSEYLSQLKSTIFIILLFQFPIIYFFKIHNYPWRYISFTDLKRFISAFIFSFSLLFILSQFILVNFFIIPKSIIVIYPILLLIFFCGTRFIYRLSRESIIHKSYVSKGLPVIIYGSGDAGIYLAKELTNSQSWNVVGFLDDDPSLTNRVINGIKVLGNIKSLPLVSKKFNVKHLIVAIPAESISSKKIALKYSKNLNIDVYTIPSIEDLISGKLNISNLFNIKIDDLLGRNEVALDISGLKGFIKNQVFFVTGAAGSIGSELCRQILFFKPKILICFDISEHSLYELEQELLFKKFSTKLIYLVGDVKNLDRVNKIISLYKPDVVFHAAAYKHVPLMEHSNVSEAFENNVMGTYNLVKACKKNNINKFILVSTDKAVNPTNIMGSTKRLAEMVCQGFQNKLKTNFVIVRFGNVLGSSGSVIPKFQEQLRKGGPLTVTHPKITRYFMSIPEAAQLVIQASFMGRGGEIFVLDMGQPIKILDLAKNIIHLSGLKKNDVKIKFTGLRPGEKLYEELLADNELTIKTSHEKIRIANAVNVDKEWLESLIIWIKTLKDKDELVIKKELKKWLKEYNPKIHN